MSQKIHPPLECPELLEDEAYDDEETLYAQLLASAEHFTDEISYEVAPTASEEELALLFSI